MIALTPFLNNVEACVSNVVIFQIIFLTLRERPYQNRVILGRDVGYSKQLKLRRHGRVRERWIRSEEDNEGQCDRDPVACRTDNRIFHSFGFLSTHNSH